VDLIQNHDEHGQNASMPHHHKDVASQVDLTYCNNAKSFNQQFALMHTTSAVLVLLAGKTLT